MGGKYNLDWTFFCHGMAISGDSISSGKAIGGSETACIQIAQTLAKQGHRPIIFCNTDGPTMRDGVTYMSIGWVQQKNGSSFPKGFFDYVRSTPHDVLVVMRLPGILQWEFKSKVNFLWQHDLATKTGPSNFHMTCWNMDRVFVLSNFMKAQYQEVHGGPDALYHVTRNGIDLEMIDSVPEQERDRFKVMFTSRPERGLDIMLREVFPRILKREPSATLYISRYDDVATLPLYQQCAQMAQQFGDRVVNLGNLGKADLYRHYKQARVFAYSSVFEEISCISLAEFSACGGVFVGPWKAALPEHTGGAPILVRDDGSIGRSGDPLDKGLGPVSAKFCDRMADEVIDLIHNDDRWETLSKAGRKRAEKWTWDEVAEDWTRLAHELIGQRTSEPKRVAKHFLVNSDVVAAQRYADHLGDERLKKSVKHYVDRFVPFMSIEDETERKQAIAKFYEERSGGDGASWQTAFWADTEPRTRVLIDWIAQHKGEVDSVLDFGCAHGGYARALSNAFSSLRVLGADVSPSLIRCANELRAGKMPDGSPACLHPENMQFMVGDEDTNCIVPNGEPEKLITLEEAEKRKFDMLVCFPAETVVYGGIQAINNLSKGQEVLGQSGETQITDTFKRPYFGELIGIKALGTPLVEMTPNHPILTTKFKRVHRKVNDWEWMKSPFAWKNAADINDGDWVVVPRILIEQEASVELTYGRNPHRVKKVINEDLAWVLGLWVAEGSLEKYHINFHLGPHESYLASKLAEKVNNSLGLKCAIHSGYDRQIRVYFSNITLRQFFEQHFGRGALNKRIPRWLSEAPKNIIRAFLDGLIAGDGTENKSNRGSRIRLKTASWQLAHGVMELLYKLGFVPSFFSEKPHAVKFGNKESNSARSYSVSISTHKWRGTRAKSKRSYTHGQIDDLYVYLPVKYISRRYFNGEVYNLETESHTYSVPFIVHNCMEVLEHLPNSEEVIKKLERHVKPGGWICATVPHGHRERDEFVTKGVLPVHVRSFDKHDLMDIFGERDGFHVVAFSDFKELDYDRTFAGWFMVFYKNDGKELGEINWERKFFLQGPRETLSVCMITNNAEATLHRALKSVHKIADQIIVVDNGPSQDSTVEIAKRYTDDVRIGTSPFWCYAHKVRHPQDQILPGVCDIAGFETPRNESTQGAWGDFIFWIDSDENLLNWQQVWQYLRPNSYLGYAVNQHHLSVDPPGSLKKDIPVRLFRNHQGMRCFGRVHEHFELAINAGVGPHVVVLPLDIHHDGYLTEPIRRGRFARNIKLLECDRLKYPDRLLGIYLYDVRDNVHMARYQMERNGGVVDEQVQRFCWHAIETFRQHFLGKDVMLAQDGINYYSDALHVLGLGVELAIDLDIKREGAHLNGGVQRFRVMDYGEAKLITDQLLRQRFGPFEGRYVS